ncbi:hypothetical protein JTE90_011497 [Oedothorax gibbosus]|uniref:Transposase n=1 Tax=Oedothorax gibbosus TaxID=931172 RepID=A0AAV6VB73_9ARAC|nr:hypothetical protein JTE90_011497 [Oedothorax gibbosus]
MEEMLPIKEKNYSRGSKEIITEKLCVLLDRCNVSDRDAVRIIAAAAEALDANLQELSLSRTTVRARRQKFREQRANIIKNRFQNSDFSNAVLHWDGKLVSHSSNKDAERLAVLISCGDEEQLIGVPEIENSKGLSQAKAVFSEINKWGAAEKIEAMCFDTTAANTGCWKGTCTLLEQYFEKHLLYLACRHHILELLLKAVFESKFGATTGPQPEMFKKFQMKWPVIDKKQYKFGIEDLLVKIHFSDLEEISGFLLNQLEQKHPRENYKEFLQFKLSTDFLKSDPSMWEQDLSFLKGKNIVRNLRVVNDTAERGVKLIQDYSNTIRKDEKQKQYLLQIISECRKIYPDVRKSSLEKPLPST